MDNDIKVGDPIYSDNHLDKHILASFFCKTIWMDNNLGCFRELKWHNHIIVDDSAIKEIHTPGRVGHINGFINKPHYR